MKDAKQGRREEAQRRQHDHLDRDHACDPRRRTAGLNTATRIGGLVRASGCRLSDCASCVRNARIPRVSTRSFPRVARAT